MHVSSSATSRVSSRATPRVLILPGWHGSGAAHWPSHWEARHCFKPVQQAAWSCPRRRDWTAHRDTAVLADPRPNVRVPQNLGRLQLLIEVKAVMQAVNAVEAVEAVGARP